MDYLGFRLICMPYLPVGGSKTHIYGSSDVTLCPSPSYHHNPSPYFRHLASFLQPSSYNYNSFAIVLQLSPISILLKLVHNLLLQPSFSQASHNPFTILPQPARAVFCLSSLSKSSTDYARLITALTNTHSIGRTTCVRQGSSPQVHTID